jgi:hypothetical protein
MEGRSAASLLAIAGGALLLLGAAAALIIGGPDTVIMGSWITVVAAVVSIGGGVLAGAMPGRGAGLIGGAAVGAGLVVPGVIPAIADATVVFLGYLASFVLLIIAAILALRDRASKATTTPPQVST